MSKISRQAYASMYGPTTGDKLRLADTDLILEVEEDLTHYGEEVTFGGGKVIRDGMGQCQRQSDEVMDLVITNALILDFWGVVKADVGINSGRIAAIGKAGNPDTQHGVDVLIGPGTEIIAGEGQILTAGGIDAHVHLICPQQAEEALASGVTTLLGGGTGPATGTNATTCTPGPWNIRRMLQAAEGLAVNVGVYGKGNGSQPNALEEQVRCGAMGLKLHEDWGTTPAAIDCALGVAEKMDVQVAIDTDTLNESGFVEDTLAAFKDRCINTYRTEGAGGGCGSAIIKAAGQATVLPSSTNPTGTDSIAAENILHDLGAFSMIASGSQAMGRVGEVISRTWQTAHKMKRQRGHLAAPDWAGVVDRGDNDNYRAKRYIAKYTINPAIAHGIAHEVGSVEVGKLADLVLWKPAFFGVKPSLVIKGGMIAMAPMGDSNASTPTSQPVHYRPMFGAFGGALAETCMTFISQWALQAGEPQRLNLRRRVGVVRDVRQVRKVDMIHNFWQPTIEVDPQTDQVRADGELLTCEPADVLPLAQRYFLF